MTPLHLDTDALLSNLDDCVVFQMRVEIDGEGEARRRLSYVSPSIEPLFGLTQADALADVMNWYRLIDPADVERVVRLESQAARLLERYRAEIAYRVLGQRRIFSIIATPVRLDDGTLQWDGVARDITVRAEARAGLREANEQTQIALREVNHRVKNLFALVPALMTLSARGKSDVGEVVASVQDRVMALARSHAMTLNAFSEDKGVALDALIRAVLEPYQDRADAFVLDGPPVRLASRDGNAMALMLHELATNAAKYGALTASRGRVAITWRVENANEPSGARLRFEWKENDGPAVAPPGKLGFGTRLIDRMILGQSGEVTRDWEPEGIRVQIALPLREPMAAADPAPVG